MSVAKALTTWDCEQQVSELTAELIRIPSENPPGDMREIAAIINDHLKRIGLTTERLESKPGMLNVIGKLDAGEGPTLVLNGHMDVVPAGERDRWSWDPFGGALEDGYVLGRGASDMKGGLAALLVALARVATFDDLRGSILFMAVPDEETGGEFGTRFLLEKDYTGDACLIAEPSGQNPTIGQKGNLWLNATTRGVSAHGSLSPLVGENAIRRMNAVIETIYSVWEEAWPLPDSARELIEHTQALLKTENLVAPGKVLGRVTVNVGKVYGGEKVNMVPSRCEAEFDLRIPIGLSTDDVLRELERRINDRFPEGVKIGPKTPPNEANYTDPDHHFVQRVLSAIREVTGKASEPMLQWASSDARFFRYRSIPTVQFGPAEMDGIHGYDERVKVEDLGAAARIYTLLMHDFLAAGRSAE